MGQTKKWANRKTTYAYKCVDSLNGWESENGFPAICCVWWISVDWTAWNQQDFWLIVVIKHMFWWSYIVAEVIEWKLIEAHHELQDYFLNFIFVWKSEENQISLKFMYLYYAEIRGSLNFYLVTSISVLKYIA